MVRRQIAEEELAEQLRNQKTPEMKNKLGEFSEAELQLKDIEKRLGKILILLLLKCHILSLTYLWYLMC